MGAFGRSQDLSAYSETDPNSRVSKTAARATGAALTRAESAYVYKDMGANWFSGNFIHRMDVCITGGNSNGRAALWALTNNVVDSYALLSYWGLFLRVWISSGGIYAISIGEAVADGTGYTATYTATGGVTYYLEIERNEAVGTYGTLYCRIYPTSADRLAGTNVLATLSLTLHAKLDLRYLFALSSYNDSQGSYNLNFWGESLDVGENWIAGGRGGHAVTTAREAGGRGLHMAIYDHYAIGGRGKHAAYNPTSAGGRGAHAVTVPYQSAGRGLHGTISSYSASGRGLHLARRTFAASGRGLHGVCRTCQAGAQGLHRAANNALARYELFRGVNASPDFAAPPWETFTSLPHTTAALDPAPAGTERTYHFVLRARNAWNLATANIDEWTVTVDDAGVEVTTRPSAPTEVAIEPAAGGKVRVGARYAWLDDGAAAAVKWLVYLRANGTSPDPAVDTPTQVSMVRSEGLVRLNWLSSAQADGATVIVIVRTRRVDTVSVGPPPVTVNVDSSNVDVHTATADTDGPAAVSPAGAFFGALHEQAQ